MKKSPREVQNKVCSLGYGECVKSQIMVIKMVFLPDDDALLMCLVPFCGAANCVFRTLSSLPSKKILRSDADSIAHQLLLPMHHGG